MNKWLKIVQQKGATCLRFSCYCLLCLQPSGRDYALCGNCENILPWLAHPCPSCALPLLSPQQGCGKCLTYPPPYRALQALFHYAWPIDGFIGQFKFGEKLHFAKLLGNLLVQRLTLTTRVDCIVPVPLHSARQSQRGFNQTLELARIVGKKLQLPIRQFDCVKVRSTKVQSSLSRHKRERNITARSFVINPSLRAKKVLVIEDIVTTGATVTAFTNALLTAGVQSVEVWAVCRTTLTH